MNQRLKSGAVTFAAGLFCVFAAGCESLDAIAVAQVDSDPANLVVTSRAQVVAELHEAQRLGLIPQGEADIPQITEEQVRRIAQAGRIAAGSAVAPLRDRVHVL